MREEQMDYQQTLRPITLILLILFSAATAHGGTVKRTSLQVANLTCSSCLVSIQEELTALPGAIGMNGDVRTGIIIVDHDPALAGETIAGVITDRGYPATIDWSADIGEQQAFSFNDSNRIASGCGGGCKASGGAASGPRIWNPEARQAGPVGRTTMQVSKLSCSSCLAKIEAELQNMAGTVGMTSDLAKGIVVVDHQDTVAAADVAAAISRLGYPARIVSTAGNATLEAKTAPGQKPASGPRYRGSNCSRRNCNATSSAWKELYRRYLSSRTPNN
jgi:mercuric ion binding protein